MIVDNLQIEMVTELNEEDLLARATNAAQEHWPDASVHGLRRLPGGVSSLTFASRMGTPDGEEREVVLKVAPPGLAPVRNRDVLRQARVMQQLDAQPQLRVPSILFEDDSVPPFFGMQLLAGDSYEPCLDVMGTPPTASVVNARARSAARMLGHLQALDPITLGLGDEPVVTVGEELDRWARLFATVDDDICPGHEKLYERLARAIPSAVVPTLIHGDYRLGNMIFAGEELAGIIDWEIWSVGDPRTDLAWLLMHTDPVHRFNKSRDQANRDAGLGMPSHEELLFEYFSVRPCDVADLTWFLAYCHYKTAATISVIAKRNRKLAEPEPSMVIAADGVSDVMTRGEEILSGVSL